jgi:hypothetical protein
MSASAAASAAAAAAATDFSWLPTWAFPFLARVSAALPRRPPQPVSSRFDLILTVILLVLMLYMVLGAVLRHVKEGIDIERSRGRGRRFPITRSLYRWYAAITLLAAAASFMADAGNHMLTAVATGTRHGPPPRLLAFWTVNFAALYVDVALCALAALRPVCRLIAHLAPQTASFTLKGPLGGLSEALGELEATELILTRVGMLGACYVLAYYGR